MVGEWEKLDVSGDNPLGVSVRKEGSLSGAEFKSQSLKIILDVPKAIFDL